MLFKIEMHYIKTHFLALFKMGFSSSLFQRHGVQNLNYHDFYEFLIGLENFEKYI